MRLGMFGHDVIWIFLTESQNPLFYFLADYPFSIMILAFLSDCPPEIYFPPLFFFLQIKTLELFFLFVLENKYKNEG